MKLFCCFLGLIFLVNAAVSASKEEPVKISRLEGTITLDGLVDEPAWQKVSPFIMTSHWPEYGNPPTDPSEIRVAYDDNYIYLSGVLDAAPENILAASFKRDLFTMGTDYLTIFLDTFNDNENALMFSTTPTGNRIDVAFFNDAGSNDESWNTFWDAEAHENGHGWTAEMRIPFSSLGFQDHDGEVTMGMVVYRYTARKNELVLYPAIEPNWGFWSFAKPSRMQKVTFTGIRSDNPVYLTPYVLGGLGQENLLNDSETAYERKDAIDRGLGLDLKYNVTDNLTFDFSLNTDFAQVEADDQQINLTRFSLFFPEKRRFFLERASIFDFSFGGPNRLFYSRQIGLNEDEQVNIIAGGRLVGRIGGWDVGVLNVQTGSETELAAENFGVLRLRKQVFNPYSFMGGMLTSRIDQNGTYNLGYGLDGVIRMFGEDYLSFNLAQTYTDTLSTGFDALEASRIRLLWENRSYNQFAYQFAVERAGKDYFPASGFELRQDFSRYFNQLSYGWTFKGHPFFQRHQIALATDVYTRHSDGVIETLDLSPSWSGALTSGSFFTLGLNGVHEHLNEGFDLSHDVDIPAGEYTYYSIFAEYNTPYGNDLSTDINARYGSFFDGIRFSAGLDPKWIASRYLELTGSYQFNHVDFQDRNQTLINHIVRLRALFTLNTAISLAAFIQYNSTAHLSLANVRFRYNPREGNDLYIVYNEQFNSDRTREIPTLPAWTNRTVIIKYTHTFTF